MESQATSNQFFVARERELARLDSFLDLAMEGNGSICFVTGEAGAGKSTLLGEFERRSHRRFKDIMFADGDCNPQTGSGDPYLPFREIMAELSGVEEGIDDRGEKGGHSSRFFQAAARALFEHGPDLIDIFVPGGALVTRVGAQAAGKIKAWKKDKNVEIASSLLAPEDGLEQRHLFEQYTNVIRALTEQRPLVLVIDDLHWADDASIGLLFHLSRRLSKERILIIGSYRAQEIKSGREGERHPLESKLNELKRYHGDIWVDLEQMDPESGSKFVDQILDAEPNTFDEEFRAALFQRTRGHALFTTELIRYLKERGFLEKNQHGEWATSSDLSWQGLPAKVEGVISERTSRLDPNEHDLLLNASILGEIFSAEILAQMLDLQVRDVVRSLSGSLSKTMGLVRARGFERTAGRRFSVYEFQHVLVQKYFYESLDSIERGFLHESAGDALEVFCGEEPGVMVIQLARHYSEGGITDKAVNYQLAAGIQARSSYANTEAIAHFSKALQMLEESSATEFAQGWYETKLAQVCISLGNVLETSGEFGNSRRRFEQALEITPESDCLVRVRLHREIATSYEREHKHNTALEYLEKAARLLDENFNADDPDQMSEWISIRNNQLWINYWQGNTDRMQELVKKTEASVVHYASASQKRRFFSGVAGLGNRLDGFLPSDKTMESARMALEAAMQCEGQIDRADGLFATGFFRMLRGETDQGLEYFSKALEIATRIGDRTLQARGLTYMCVLKRRAGDVDGVGEFLQPAHAISESIGMQEYVAVSYANRSWLAWKKGEFDKASKLAILALEVWQERAPKYPFKWLACLQLIDIAHREKDLALAVDYVEKMMAPPSATLVGGIKESIAQAVSGYSAGNMEAAHDHFEAALKAANDNGYL